MAYRRRTHEENDNQDRWLVSYSDFMTLLFGFFVVMYAISSVNEGKYRILSETLTAVFHNDPKSLEPIEIGEPAPSSQPAAIQLQAAAQHLDPDPGNTAFAALPEQIETRFAGLLASQDFEVTDHDLWIEVDVNSDVMFSSGGARLDPSADRVLDEVGDLLNAIGNPVTVEGYTDALPQSGAWPSNWELSAARATAVVRALQERGVRPSRLAAVGYGENHPVATNATAAGRRSNRRVTLIVARNDGVQRNLAAVSGSRRPDVDIAWRSAGDQAPTDGTAAGDNVINAIRQDDGSVVFTADPEGTAP